MSTHLRDNILLGCAVLGGIAATVQIFGSFGVRSGGAMPFDVILAISAVVNAAIAWWFWRSLRAARSNAHAVVDLGAITVLKLLCGDLLRSYRHLDHDHRERVQYPLHEKFWPAFGETWDEVHVELVMLRSQLDLIVTTAKATWETRNLEPQQMALFSLSESTKILDLISALEKFIQAKPKSPSATVPSLHVQ